MHWFIDLEFDFVQCYTYNFQITLLTNQRKRFKFWIFIHNMKEAAYGAYNEACSFFRNGYLHLKQLGAF